jgi:hypothetical protein
MVEDQANYDSSGRQAEISLLFGSEKTGDTYFCNGGSSATHSTIHLNALLDRNK